MLKHGFPRFGKFFQNARLVFVAVEFRLQLLQIFGYITHGRFREWLQSEPCHCELYNTCEAGHSNWSVLLSLSVFCSTYNQVNFDHFRKKSNCFVFAFENLYTFSALKFVDGMNYCQV